MGEGLDVVNDAEHHSLQEFVAAFRIDVRVDDHFGGVWWKTKAVEGTS
jgi:hypothetical protein